MNVEIHGVKPSLQAQHLWLHLKQFATRFDVKVDFLAYSKKELHPFSFACWLAPDAIARCNR
jgi:hypothetical protein